MLNRVAALAALSAFIGLYGAAQNNPRLRKVQSYDLVVYGGTAGGVVTAVAAAREGLKVALLEPGLHIGGMVSGGLSRTDHGRRETIGGYSLEFYRRLGKHYGDTEVEWYPEPHVAEKVLNDMLKEAGVEVFLHHRLAERRGINKGGAVIRTISTENGSVFGAKIFADATYEGDLMAQARIDFTWGREGVKEYGESLAGVRPKDRAHQFDMPVSAYWPDGTLLPEIQKGPRGELGEGDRKVQAYNFRLCLSRDRNNQIPFPRPAGYDPKRFELLVRWLEALQREKGRVPRMNEVTLPGPIRNNKIDLNNRGAFSTDYIGKSWDYPNGSYKQREAIWRDHLEYTQEYLYFMANDPRVPKPLQAEINEWGLAKDEFADNGHWPYQLYVREARRMVGDFVMIQKDIQTERTKPDVIGMGSYNSDSHNVQRYVTPEGNAQNEGNMEVGVKPYQIPYRILLPKRSQAANLLVPVCFSASHVTYSTLRMEPVYMIIGHAAGVASSLAVKSGKPVQEIDVAALQSTLKKQGAVFEYAEAAR